MNDLQLFRLISLYHLRRHRLRTLFVILIVLAGTALMTLAINVAANTDRSFALGGSVITGAVDLDIRSPENRLTLDALEAVRSTDGVQTAAPLLITGALVLGGADLIGIWGIDPAVDNDIRSYTVIEGATTIERGTVWIGTGYATARELTVGESISLIAAGGLKRYVIAGLLAREGVGALNGGDLIIMDYRDAFDLTRGTALTAIGVRAADGVDHAALQAQLGDRLGVGFSVAAAAVRSEKTAVQTTSQALSLITNAIQALLGAFLITETIAASIAQRRKEIAILRALGVTSGGIRRLFLIEVAIVGLVGALLGMILGVATTANNPTYAQIDGVRAAVEVITPFWVPPLALILGTLITVGAAWFPAKRVVEIDPTEAMREPIISVETAHYGWRRIVIAFIVIALAVGARVVFDNTPAVPLAVVASPVLTIVALALLYPPVLVWFSRYGSTLLGRIFGVSGILAGENMTKRYHRAIPIGLLTVITAWFWLMGVTMNNASREAVSRLIDSEIQWDLTFSGPGRTALDPISGIPADIADAIAEREDMSAIVRERQAEITVQGFKYTIRAIDISAFRAGGGAFPWETGDEASAYAQLATSDSPTMLAGGFEALSAGLRVPGAVAELTTPNGTQTFTVVGSIHSGIGVLVMDYEHYSRLFNDTGVDRLYVNLQPGSNVDAVRRELAGQYVVDGIYVADKTELRTLIGTGDTGSQNLAVLFLPFMVLGIGNLLFIAVMDRRREIGVLRAVGTLRRQVTFAVILEAVLLVGSACLLAVPGMYFTFENTLFGRITGQNAALPLTVLLPTVALIVLTGALSAYLPARRAGRLDILEALHYE